MPPNEQQIRQIVRDEINRGSNKSRFELQSIKRHTHDGVDSLNISEDNVLLTKKLFSQLISTESETFTLRNVYNVSRISFHGIAYDSSVSPATKKSSITGEVIFGQCSQFVGQGSSIAVVTSGDPSAFTQFSNSTYLDTVTPANSSVTANPSLAYTGDSGVADFVTFTLDRYIGDTLTFTVTLAANWVLNGYIIIE